MILLDTPRLLIRDHKESDLETHHALLSDAKAMWYLQDIMTHSIEESRADLTRSIAEIDAAQRACYFLRIEDRGTGEHIGEIGYTVDEFTPSGKLVSAGYFIRGKFWGQGYTAEAFCELIRFAFEEDGVCRISCGCLREHKASERVMQKCGMIKEAERVAYQWHDGRLRDRVEYRLLPAEWRAGVSGQDVLSRKM